MKNTPSDYIVAAKVGRLKGDVDTMTDPRFYANPNDVIVDYLKDIRDQLAALNRKIDELTINNEDQPALRIYDTFGG